MAESEPHTRSSGPDCDATSRTSTHALTGSPLSRRSAATLIRSAISTSARAPAVRPPLVNHDSQRRNRLLPALCRHGRRPRRPNHYGRRTTLRSRHICNNDGPCRTGTRPSPPTPATAHRATRNSRFTSKCFRYRHDLFRLTSPDVADSCQAEDDRVTE